MNLKEEIIEQLEYRWNNILILIKKDNIEYLAFCIKTEIDDQRLYTIFINDFMEPKTFKKATQCLNNLDNYNILGYEIIEPDTTLDSLFTSINVEYKV